MGRKKREPMDNIDTAWYRMEDPANLMMVSAFMTLEGRLDFDRFMATIKHHLLYFDRFKQKVVTEDGPLGGTYWEDDPNFDIHNHIERITLPGKGTKQDLEDFVSRAMSRSLDYDQPLWHVYVIDNYEDGSAFLIRLHHCIADGRALIRVLLKITNEIDEEDIAPEPEKPKPPKRFRFKSGLPFIDELVQPAVDFAHDTLKTTDKFLREGIEIIRDPSRISKAAQLAAGSVTSLGRLLFRWPDPPTILKGKLGRPKRASWSEPLPLQDIKDIKNATGTTVNDVLVAAIAGAVRKYMISRRQPVKGINIRAAVPVDLRSENEELELGNKFGLVFLSLPVGMPGVRERLLEQKRRMDDLKNTPEAYVVLNVLDVVGKVPQEIQDLVVQLIGSKTSMVMTNVPGPEKPLKLLGNRIKNIMFWVPQSGRVGLGISVISYNNQVRVGIASDQGMVPDPQKLVETFQHELEDLWELIPEDQRRKPNFGYEAQADNTTTEIQDKITEESEEEEQPSQSQTIDRTTLFGEEQRCIAITHTGKRCKNSAVEGSEYCQIHQNGSVKRTIYDE